MQFSLLVLGLTLALPTLAAEVRLLQDGSGLHAGTTATWIVSGERPKRSPRIGKVDLELGIEWCGREYARSLIVDLEGITETPKGNLLVLSGRKARLQLLSAKTLEPIGGKYDLKGLKQPEGLAFLRLNGAMTLVVAERGTDDTAATLHAYRWAEETLGTHLAEATFRAPCNDLDYSKLRDITDLHAESDGSLLASAGTEPKKASGDTCMYAIGLRLEDNTLTVDIGPQLALRKGRKVEGLTRLPDKRLLLSTDTEQGEEFLFHETLP